MSSIMYEIKVTDPEQVGMLPPNLLNCEWIQNLRQDAGMDKVWYTAHATDLHPDCSTYTIYVQFPDVATLNNWLNTWRMNESIRQDFDLWVSNRNLTITEKYFVFDDSEESKTTIQPGQGIWN